MSLCSLVGFGSRTASAQQSCPATINGSIDPTDPTETGRIFRNGTASVCGTAKAFPNMFDANPYAYDKYLFANRTGASACVTFTLTQPSTTFSMHLVGYSRFVPTIPATNYLGDSGTSSVSGSAVSMNLTLTAGQTVDIVVHTVTQGATGPYTLTASGCGAPSTPTLALVSSANPSVSGQNVTFTGTVSGGVATATGTITFFDGASQIGTAALDGAGSGSLATSALSVGAHSITYSYGGDFYYSSGTSSAVAQQVNAADTTTTLTSSTNPSIVGGSVTFTATVAPVNPGAGTPTGTVTFSDGTTSIGTGVLGAGGIATFTTSTLTVGTRAITAAYGGSTNFNGSTSAVVSQVVNQDGTTVDLASSSNPSTYATSVTFTATATTGAMGGVPTGTMTFSDGATPLGAAVPLTNGVATFATSTLTGGSHSISAAYSGDTNHKTASSSLTQVVNPAGSGTTVVSTTNPSVFGQSVTFTASVSGSGATPTGIITFLDGASVLGTGALDGAGQATLTTAALTVGAHPITAAYAGDTNYGTSTSAALSQQVNAAATTTTLTSSSNPSIVGSTVTFTASIAATAPGAGVPTGTVTFREGANVLGTGTLNGAGVATFASNALGVGTHTITADYAGDAGFNASTTNLSQVVNQDGDTLSMMAFPNPSTFGTSVTFTATVMTTSTGGTPTGTVTFDDGGTVIATVALTSGVATFSTAALTAGTHTINATYGGDANHAAGSTASVMEVVSTAATTTALASSANPSVFGQSITFTTTVTSGAPGTPTGTVTFKDGATTLGIVTVDGTGAAALTTNKLVVATHAISAVYSGDTNYATSTSPVLSQVVNQAATSTAIASSSNPSLVNATVTLTATVTPTAPGAGVPSGTVTFMDGTNILGTGTVDGAGVATFASSKLTTGAHTITVSYGGDGSFLASVSSALTQTVSTSAATVVVTAAPTPSTFGVSVTFTATVTGTNGVPTGSVAFSDNGTTLGTGTLSAGVATFSTAALPAGTHTITAAYGGDATYAAAMATVSQVVNKADTTTTIVSSSNPSTVGDSVTFTATVGSSASGFTGQVEFFDGTTSLGIVMLSGPTATFTATGLTQGGHSVIAKYDGDASFNTSSSTALTQTVNARASSPDMGSAGGVKPAGRGGGCSCRMVPSGETGLGWPALLVGLVLVLARRRRRA